MRERTIRTVVASTGLYSAEEIEVWASGFSADRVAANIAQGLSIVAERQGAIVGCGRLVVEQGMTIRGVFVACGAVRQGVGRRIVERLLGMSGPAERVGLVSTLNAKGFYERLGFTATGLVMHTTSHGAVIPGYEMVWRSGPIAGA